MDYIYSELLDIGKLKWDGLQTSTSNVIVNNIDSTIAVDVDGIKVEIEYISEDRIRVRLKDRENNILSESITDPLNETLTNAEYDIATQILTLTLDRGTRLLVDLTSLASKAYADDNIAAAITTLLENGVYQNEAADILVNGTPTDPEAPARVVEKSSLYAIKDYVEQIFENINLTYIDGTVRFVIKNASLVGNLNEKSFEIKDIKNGILLQGIDPQSNLKTFTLRLFRESGSYIDIDLTALSMEGLVEEERERAVAAETQIAEDLATEITRATTEEVNIAQTLSNEITRSTERDQQLTTRIANEELRASNAETAISNALTEEINRATGAEEDISQALSTEISRASEAEESLRQGIINEATARDTADTILQENIDNSAHSLEASATWSAQEEAYIVNVKLLNAHTESGEDPILSNVNVKIDLPQLSYEDAMEILSSND